MQCSFSLRAAGFIIIIYTRVGPRFHTCFGLLSRYVNMCNFSVWITVLPQAQNLYFHIREGINNFFLPPLRDQQYIAIKNDYSRLPALNSDVDRSIPPSSKILYRRDRNNIMKDADTVWHQVMLGVLQCMSFKKADSDNSKLKATTFFQLTLSYVLCKNID